MFVASFKDAWNKKHPLKLQELQLRPGVQADQASGGGVVAEAGARREMMVLRSRTTLSQLLLIQLTNTIWDKYTLICGIAKQNGRTTLSQLLLIQLTNTFYNLRQIHFKMMVLRSKTTEQLCLNCFWSIVCSLQPLQPLHTLHLKFLKFYIFIWWWKDASSWK